jgi:hypothetical protein
MKNPVSSVKKVFWEARLSRKQILKLELCTVKSHFMFLQCTIIPQYTSNRFTSFRLYKTHKLIPVFQFTSQFLLIRATSSHKPVVPVEQ